MNGTIRLLKDQSVLIDRLSVHRHEVTKTSLGLSGSDQDDTTGVQKHNKTLGDVPEVKFMSME